MQFGQQIIKNAKKAASEAAGILKMATKVKLIADNSVGIAQTKCFRWNKWTIYKTNWCRSIIFC